LNLRGISKLDAAKGTSRFFEISKILPAFEGVKESFEAASL
jgi:hypothetical protein